MTKTNWDLFRLFATVAHVGSLNRAARELGMSQPTLSRRLKELEFFVGAPLFFRASSGMQLTQEGEYLRHAAGGIVDAFHTFQGDLRLHLRERSSVVKISASDGVTKHWLMPRIRKLHEVNSRVRLEIVSTIRQQSVAGSDLDFVIRLGSPGDKELVGKRVASIAFGLFASRDYLAHRPAPQTLDELANHDFIGHSPEGVVLESERAGRMQLLSSFNAAARTRSLVRVSLISDQFAAARAGLGLAFLAAPFAEAEGLVRVLPDETPSMDVWLLRRRESDLRKLTRDVRRFLEREFSASKGWLAGVASRESAESLKRACSPAGESPTRMIDLANRA